MACKKCGSDWKTATGKDCSSCPHCCKRQRHEARSQGRWAEVTEVVVCKVCNKTFTNIGAAVGKTKCCSAECTTASRKAWRTAYMAEYKRGNRRGTQATKRLPKPSCKRCGAAFKRRHGGHDANLYCSTTCFFGAVREGSQQFKGRCHGLEAALADWAYEWDAQRPKKRRDYKPRPPCEVCGAEVNHMGSKCCSLRCKQLWRGTRQCNCGSMVEDARLFGRCYCRECKIKSKRARRRMYGCYRRRCRTYGGFFNPKVKPVDVFKRDGYVCHICRKKTRRVFNHNDPLSATVDHHPIPLSKGGDHDWHNVRCACRRCNELKGNKWDGQARLRLACK